jgi:uncharacterized membrane-anchored protein
MRRVLVWGTLLLVLIAVNYWIAKREETLATGRTVLLRLAPADPRSLIQGDYMRLRYAIADTVPAERLDAEGRIVVSLDAQGVAAFVRLHRGEALQPGEHLLFYRNRGGLRLGAEAFFFQEGDAPLYENARYGELRVDDTGASVLVGLRGEDLRPLGRGEGR